MSNDPLLQAGLEYQAQAHADAARTNAQVAEFVDAQQASASPAPPEKSKEQLEAEALAQAAEAALPQITLIAWKMADKAIQSFGGAHCAADADELAQLAKLSVPVLNKYLGSLSGFITTPEGLLLAVAAMTYGPKLIAGPPKIPAGSAGSAAGAHTPEPVGSTPTPATTTSPGATA